MRFDVFNVLYTRNQQLTTFLPPENQLTNNTALQESRNVTDAFFPSLPSIARIVARGARHSDFGRCRQNSGEMQSGTSPEFLRSVRETSPEFLIGAARDFPAFPGCLQNSAEMQSGFLTGVCLLDPVKLSPGVDR